jgi:hypothetical protein
MARGVMVRGVMARGVMARGVMALPVNRMASCALLQLQEQQRANDVDRATLN